MQVQVLRNMASNGTQHPARHCMTVNSATQVSNYYRNNEDAIDVIATGLGSWDKYIIRSMSLRSLGKAMDLLPSVQ